MKYHCQGSFSLRKCEVERKKNYHFRNLDKRKNLQCRSHDITQFFMKERAKTV